MQRAGIHVKVAVITGCQTVIQVQQAGAVAAAGAVYKGQRLLRAGEPIQPGDDQINCHCPAFFIRQRSRERAQFCLQQAGIHRVCAFRGVSAQIDGVPQALLAFQAHKPHELLQPPDDRPQLQGAAAQADAQRFGSGLARPGGRVVLGAEQAGVHRAFIDAVPGAFLRVRQVAQVQPAHSSPSSRQCGLSFQVHAPKGSPASLCSVSARKRSKPASN